MVRQHIPTWTMMDIQKAREHAASIEGSGSTTPLLDKYDVPRLYRSAGVVYIDHADLQEAAVKATGKRLDLYWTEEDGVHPWCAEILLKNHLKKHLQDQKPEASSNP